MGRTHALSGAVAYLALVPLLHASAVQAAVGAVCTAGAALLPDLDHPQATATHTLGPVTRVLGWVVRRLAGGHRRGSHSVLGIAAFAGVAALAARADIADGIALWVLAALAARAVRRRAPVAERLAVAVVTAGGAWWLVAGHGLDPWFLPVAVAIGAAAHVVGDLMTEQGARVLWPLSARSFRIASIDTGHAVERWLVAPALWAALAVLVYRTATPVFI